MSITRNSGPECPISLRPKTTTATKVLIVSALVVIACCLSSAPAHAQYGSLSIGQVINVTSSTTACLGGGWATGTNCYTATLTGCANITDLNFTFGYVLPTTTTLNGTIVFFNGGPGTDPAGAATGAVPGETQYITDYLAAGYQIVQIAWNAPWEQALIPWPQGNTPLGNVQAGACRPATFLNYVFNSPFMYQLALNGNKNLGANPNAGMCAQGASAGSAQVAYSLAYYGPPAAGSWYIDNVELISGPVLSDIKQGCQQPAAPNVNVCPSGQFGCQLGPNVPGGNIPWTLSPTYLAGTNQGVAGWTDDATCAAGSNTSSQSNSLWLAQSIVDQSTGATPTFAYPHTAMAAWLCRSVANPQTAQNCSAYPVKYDEFCPNNSSPQGQIFYAQITQSNSPLSYNVYAVDNCTGPEGAPSTGAWVSALSVPPGYQDGYDAIKYDMIGGGPNQRPTGCFHNSH
jgi:hypothetical protein